MTCRRQVIGVLRLVVLIAALLGAPVNTSALRHSPMDEIAGHALCPHMEPILDKSRLSDCAICIVGVIDNNVSLDLDRPIRELSLLEPEEGKGVDPEPLKKPPRIFA